MLNWLQQCSFNVTALKFFSLLNTLSLIDMKRCIIYLTSEQALSILCYPGLPIVVVIVLSDLLSIFHVCIIVTFSRLGAQYLFNC